MSNSRHRPRRALIVTLAVGFPVSALFLWLSIRDANLAAVWTTIGGARPAPIFAALGALALMYWLQAVRWRRIARADLPSRSVYAMVLAGLAVNNVVPGRVGDLLRARWISRAIGVSGGRGLATVVFDRGGDLVVLAGTLFLFLPLVTHAPWIDRLVVGAGVVVSLFVIALLAARAYVRHRPRGATTRDRGVVRRLARDTLDGLSQPMSTPDVVVVLLLSVAAWVAWACAALSCASSIGIELTPAEGLFLAGAVNLGVAIPSSPGFVGTYQWLIVSTLALYGIDHDAALAFAVLFQACWYIPTTLVGGVLLARRIPSSVRISSSALPTAEQSARARA